MGSFGTWFAAHRKAITGVVGVAVGALTVAVGADNKWVTLLVAVATVAGVYAVPNRSPGNPPVIPPRA